MIDREKLNKVLDAVEALNDPGEATITIDGKGHIAVSVYPKDWWSRGDHWTEDQRHQNLATLTPLVGRLDKTVSDGNIGYSGQANGISIKLNYIERCKIVGYKTVKKTVKREIDRPVEYEEVEEETQIPITDCDIRMGKASETDIEVPA